MRCIDPRDDSLLGFVTEHSREDVTNLVALARKASVKWSKSTFEQRNTVLYVLRDYILYNQKMLVELCETDSGKTALEAHLGDILPTLEKIRWLVNEGKSAIIPSSRSVGPLTIHKKAAVEYMPMGVIAAIAPWNYPLHNFLNPVVAALYAGNAVVVKVSEYTIYSSLHFVRIIRRALTLCGHDPDLVQLLIGGGDVGKQLVTSDIDKLFFTGSTAIGKLVAISAAERLLPVCLELGGKDAFVICDDAEIKHAAGHCLRGVYQNAGQNCIGVGRVFVHKKVVKIFLEIVNGKVAAVRLGVDMGALTMGERAVMHIQGLVDDAVKKGAKLEMGGKRGYVKGKGWYYEATVLSGVTTQMRIANEEVFGPVMSIFEWQDEEELIHMVNSCAFGLGSAVFSENYQRANGIIQRLRVGMSNVNDFGVNYLCQSMPFGGTKDSGSDRFAGIEGLRGCCIPKSVTRDRWWGVKTRVPRPFQYPVTDNAPEFAAEINDLIYGSVWSVFDNMRNVVGMLLFAKWKPRCVGNG